MTFSSIHLWLCVRVCVYVCVHAWECMCVCLSTCLSRHYNWKCVHMYLYWSDAILSKFQLGVSQSARLSYTCVCAGFVRLREFSSLDLIWHGHLLLSRSTTVRIQYPSTDTKLYLIMCRHGGNSLKRLNKASEVTATLALIVHPNL